MNSLINRFMTGFIFTLSLVSLFPLISIIQWVATQGFSGLDWNFFTSLPAPVGEPGGGMGHAILGTLILVGLASFIGIPWGIAVGLFLSEYSDRKLAAWAKSAIDILSSVPSIIIGLFVYSIVVVPMKHFSAHAGGIALAIIMIPMVARGTEEILKMLPNSIREAGLALGLPRWKVILWIVLKGNRGPLSSVILLAIARVSGETAPLLFTSMNSRFWPSSLPDGLNEPMSALPVQIYTYAISPFPDWQKQAWAGALILMVMVTLLNLITKLLITQREVRKSK